MTASFRSLSNSDSLVVAAEKYYANNESLPHWLSPVLIPL